MTITTVAIPDSPGADFLVAVNERFASAFKLPRSATTTRPVEASAGGLWVYEASSTVWQQFFFDGTHDILIGTLNPTSGAWVPAGTGDKVIAVTSSTTLTATHANALLVVDATAGAVTLTLPTIASVGEPYNVRVKKADSSANAVTIARSGTDTINGGTSSLSLTTQNAAVTVSADIDVSPDNWVSVNAGGGVSESYVTSAIAAAVAAIPSPLGVGQTWQNVLASRSSGTTYTNSTGRPIAVSVRTGTGGGSSAITVAGVVVAQTANDFTQSLFTVVPAGATYVVSGSISMWAELR